MVSIFGEREKKNQELETEKGNHASNQALSRYFSSCLGKVKRMSETRFRYFDGATCTLSSSRSYRLLVSSRRRTAPHS